MKALCSHVQAAALGVPRGPLYGKLVRGERVEASSGRTVTPEEVMEPATPGRCLWQAARTRHARSRLALVLAGPVVLLVDCPSDEFLPALLASKDLLAWQEEEARSKGMQGRRVCSRSHHPGATDTEAPYCPWAAP